MRKEHDIKIIRVSDNGDVDFVLYGYMNRGVREGYCGVCVYHYSNDQNVVEEKVFIPSTESYEFLKEDLGTLSYVSTDNFLFLLFAQKLYRVNISEETSEVLDEGIHTDEFAVSETNAHAAWVIQKGESAGNIKEIDFETLETRTLAPSDGQSLVLSGFMNEDMVYGIVVDGDIVTDSNGHETTGIHTIRIEAFDGTLKKEYHQEGLYITNVTMGSTIMEFQLSQKTGSGYQAVDKDNILNNTKASANTVSVELVSSTRAGTQIRLSLDEAPEIQEPLVIYSKMKSVKDEYIALDTQMPDDNVYYVYAKGGLDSTYTDPAQAVLRADEQTGVVTREIAPVLDEIFGIPTTESFNIVWNKIMENLWDIDSYQDIIDTTARLAETDPTFYALNEMFTSEENPIDDNTKTQLETTIKSAKIQMNTIEAKSDTPNITYDMSDE